MRGHCWKLLLETIIEWVKPDMSVDMDSSDLWVLGLVNFLKALPPNICALLQFGVA